MQQCAGVYLLQNYSTCFRSLPYPSSGVHQTVTAASGTGHSVTATTFLQRGLIWCTPDDGYDRHPKHVVNKHLHNVASRWILLLLSHDARNREYKYLAVMFRWGRNSGWGGWSKCSACNRLVRTLKTIKLLFIRASKLLLFLRVGTRRQPNKQFVNLLDWCEEVQYHSFTDQTSLAIVKHNSQLPCCSCS